MHVDFGDLVKQVLSRTVVLQLLVVLFGGGEPSATSNINVMEFITIQQQEMQQILVIHPLVKRIMLVLPMQLVDYFGLEIL